ncbi:DOMON-like domain-containing protein [Ottowia sp.]|uniref:DOMON-like domain-containing protein n=1 Tax=Ottowia sp. TaxID=1898956 RepID=UPI003A871AE3
MSATARQFLLQPHPTTPPELARHITSLQVHVLAGASGPTHLRYALTGDVAQLLVPTASPRPAPADGLWQRTCFELFVGHAQRPAYREFNFSPSGDWAMYDFSAKRVRDGHARPDDLPAPRITCTRTPTTLTLDVRLQAPWIAISPTTPDTLIGLSAVIEHHSSLPKRALSHTVSYWALTHPAAQPDFHQHNAWTVWRPDYYLEPINAAMRDGRP